MKASNPKQVAILGVVAVAALGYLGHSLFGIGNSVVAGITGQSETPPASETPDPPSVELLGDPFSHPKLASNVSVSPPPSPTPSAGTSTAPETGSPAPTLPPPAIGGSLPVKPQFDIVPEPTPKPAESAGIDREENESRGPKVVLTAIVKVDKPVAFLSLNGGDSRAYRTGDLLAPGVRLTYVGNGFIRFQSPKASFHMSVGQEIEL